MKKHLLILALITISPAMLAQTIVFTEDFESGGSNFDLNTASEGGVTMDVGFNQWTVNGVYGFGAFTETCNFSDVYVNPVPAQPSGISSAGGQYMHIYSDVAAMTAGGSFNCNYFTSDGGSCSSAQTHFAEMNTDISTVGKTNVTLNFWWLCDGNAFGYGQVYYSTDGGSTWTQLTSPLDKYRDVLDWSEQTITDAAFDGHATLRFGFRFVVEDDLGTGYENMMAFGIDDVEVTVEDAPPCAETTNSITVDECFEYTVPSGDETYMISGTVMDTIPNAAGCDSVLTIDLNITDINTAVIYASAVSLMSEEASAGVTYQWVNCPAFDVFAGATDQEFTPGIAGEYAVIITNGSCSDTSDCYTIDMFSIDEYNLELSVYPNPAQQIFTIDLGSDFSEVKLEIADLSGRMVLRSTYLNASSINVSLPNLSEGVYIITAQLNGEHKVTQKITIY